MARRESESATGCRSLYPNSTHSVAYVC